MRSGCSKPAEFKPLLKVPFSAKPAPDGNTPVLVLQIELNVCIDCSILTNVLDVLDDTNWRTLALTIEAQGGVVPPRDKVVLEWTPLMIGVLHV